MSVSFDPGVGGGGPPTNGLMEMCRWMGSNFHDWIGYNGACIFNRVPYRCTRMGSQTVGILGRKMLASGI